LTANKRITQQVIDDYNNHLNNEELRPNSISKYIHDLKLLYNFLGDAELTQKNLIGFKKDLEAKEEQGEITKSTLNSRLISINKFLKWYGLEDATLKLLKVQTKTTLDDILSETDYNRILRMAKNRGSDRDVIILEVISNTGLRVSEIKFLTVDALKKGYMDITNKGKTRRVPIPDKLAKKLKEYIKENGIKDGYILVTRNGKPLNRSYIYTRIRWLGGQARVKKEKCHPHSLRHLFAKRWISKNGNNPLQLADILGHSSLETTRIYTKLDTKEAKETMNF
jgi:integrase/recombinase XerD